MCWEATQQFRMAKLKRFFSKFFYLITLGFIFSGCQSIPSDKNTLVLGEDGWNSNCISLRAIKIDDDGAALLFFEKPSYDGYSMCHTALVSSVVTQPTKTIISANDIYSDGSVVGSFSLKVKPNTSRVIMATTDLAGASTTLQFDVAEHIRQAQVLHQNTAWMDGLTQNQATLVDKKTNDNEPPKFRFNEQNLNKNKPVFVENYVTFLRGKVTDNTAVMTVLVNGKKIRLTENGDFAAKIKLKLGKNEVLVKAEDLDNNVTEQRLVFVRKEFILNDNLADVDIPSKSGMEEPEDLAVVIGIENYQYVPDATYAYNDAEVFREYLVEALGLKRQRVKLVTNGRATKAEIDKLLGPNGWVARNLIKGKSDLIVYFSGHGIASVANKSSGLLPYDVDPNYSVGIEMSKLYGSLASMGAKSITIFLDACFTGQTRNSEMLIKNTRPIVIKPTVSDIPEGITIMSAASGTQISGAIEEKEHGLFTYYTLKGLGGGADTNNDSLINTFELRTFLTEKVADRAVLDGREQTPFFHGDLDRVLVEFQ